MFNIGGRGAAWGLFCPRIHDEPFAAMFGTNLSEILGKWYTEVEILMQLSLPLIHTIHRNVIERLNIKTKSKGYLVGGDVSLLNSANPRASTSLGVLTAPR